MTPDSPAPRHRPELDASAPAAPGDRFGDWDWWAVRYRLDELDPDQCWTFEATLEHSQEARDALATAAALIDTLEQALDTTIHAETNAHPARSHSKPRARVGTVRRATHPLRRAAPWSLAAAALLALGVGIARNLPSSQPASTEQRPLAQPADERLLALAVSWSKLRDQSDSEKMSDLFLNDLAFTNLGADFEFRELEPFEDAPIDDDADLGAALAWASFDRDDEPTHDPPSWMLEATALTQPEAFPPPSASPPGSSPDSNTNSPAPLDDSTATDE